jgi:uncharacterized protein
VIRAFLIALALAGPVSALDVPFLSGRVNDHAGLLSTAAHENLETALKDFEQRTGHQLAVLTVPSLQGEVLEDFSLKVSRTWGLGRKGVNDGILLLVSREDRKLRIEVGHGLEGTLPDILCGRIIQDVIVPRFRAGDFEGGVAAGVEAIIAAAEGHYTPPPRRSPRNDFAEMSLIGKIFMSLFLFVFIGLFEIMGIALPGFGWFLYVFLIPFWTAFPGALWGIKVGLGCLLAHLIGFPLAKVLIPKSGLGARFSRGSAGEIYYKGYEIMRVYDSSSRGRGGGDSGGGWSSGGGFSGGGGSFGGGGSSGSW